MTKLATLFFFIGVIACAAEPTPAFSVSDGLFDLSNQETLGLKNIPAEHAEIHHATEESGFRFSHHPGLTVFKNRLYCSWSSGRAHEDRPDQRVLFSSSGDGKTWTEPQVLATPAEGSRDSCIAAGFHVSGEKLVGYYTVRYDYPTHNLYNPKNAVYARTSSDGNSWSEPQKVASGFFIEAPRSLANGRLFLGGEHAGENWKTHQVRMRLLFSDASDGISDWQDAAIDPAAAEPNGLKVFGYTEPSPFVRKDGVIVCSFRNQSGFLYASESSDNGETWSVLIQTNFPDSMARFATGKLPDGRIFLINNPGPGRMNRSLLTIALSNDGSVFDRAWLIRSEPTTQRFDGKGKRDGWQYPSAVVWRDALWIAYSVNKEDVSLTRISLEAFQ